MKIAIRVFLLAFLPIAFSCNQQKVHVRKATEALKPASYIGKKVPADSIQPPAMLPVEALQPTVNTTLGAPRILSGTLLPHFTSYNPEQWLQTGNLLCGFSDSRGNLWVGSSGGGLTRYDGKTATNFNKANGLANNTVKCITEDAAGNIWVGTVDGLSKYDGRSFISYTQSNGLPNNNIMCLLPDAGGVIWAGTFKGLVKIDGSKFTALTAEQGLPANIITCVAKDKSGNLWIGTGSSGVCKYDGKSFIVYNKEKGLANNIVRSIAADSAGNIWVGTFGDGVSVFNGSAFTNYSLAQGLAGNKVNAISSDNGGRVWLGTNNGICAWDGTAFQSYSVPGNEVKSIARDKDGAIWFIGSGDINLYHSPAVRFFPNVQKGLVRCGVKTIAEDAQHHLWMGTDGDGLNFYDGMNLLNYSLPQGLPDSFVNCVLPDKKNNIWVGTTSAGIGKITGKTYTGYTTAQGLAYDEVNCIVEDGNGSLWIGTENGLSRYDGKVFQNYGREQGLPDVHIKCLYADLSGLLWIGTRKGLCILDGKNVTLFTTEQGLAGNEINAITSDGKGKFYIATTSGLTCAIVSPGGKAPFTWSNVLNIGSDEGLPDNNITQLNLMPDGRIIAGFATKVGLATFNPSKPIGADGKLAQLELLNNNNGFPVRGLNPNPGSGCLHLDSNGVVWAGITDPVYGLMKFDARRYFGDRKQTAPRIVVDKIKINWRDICWYLLASKPDSLLLEQQLIATYDKKLSADERDSIQTMLADVVADSVAPFYPVPQHLLLPYTDNNVTIGFNSSAATRTGVAAYSYMLDGYDADWSPAMKQQEATFGNINEGSYTFKVRAQTADGSWSEAVSYSFTVLPPWYRTKLAYLAYIIFLFGGIIIIFRWRTAALKRRQRELERTVDERTAEIVQKNKVVEQQKHEIEQEKELTEQQFRRSEELLLNILPSEVAEELKQKGAADARHYDDVTVLFTDFTNFTKAGERMTARELVGELHDCFKAFDNICDKYHIEKIKTVGDAYLAVCGLPAKNENHARNVVSAALEIRDFMVARKEQLGDSTFGIRIGINTGAVVAGIVGIRKFAFDIWGDTVNTAARMEQNSDAGKINISESTYQSVKDEFACEHRGKVAAKNKGSIDMYFVERKGNK